MVTALHPAAPPSVGTAPPATRIPRREHRSRLRRILSVHVPLLLICCLWLVPTLELFVSSFRTAADTYATGWWRAADPPLAFTEQNYVAVLTAGGMGRAFLNSLLITVPSVSLLVSIGAVAAYTLARMRFRGSRLIFALVLGLAIVPLQTILVPVLRLYNQLDITGTWPGIWLVHAGVALPFVTYLLHNFFRALPREMFEAAEIDGADPVACFVRVALPTSVPALASVVIFQFLWVWNDLLLALIFLGGDARVAPLTVTLSGLVNAITGQGWHLLTAAAFVSVVCPLIVFFALQRYFVRGLLAGSLK
jgi:alpha-glucoside transport system permease protein